MAFDRDTRNKLAAFVHDCRRRLCGEYNRPGGEIARLLAHYGIQVTGEVTEVEQLPHLDESGRDTARLLREILNFKRANSPQTRIWRDYDPAVYDLLQEQAFTVLNRLCALRMAEARGILIPCVSEKTQSQGFQLYEYQSGKSDDPGSRYRHFLFSVFDEIAVDLPALFDRYSPQGLLFPSHSCIEDLLDAINAEALQPLWGEDETIGWVYQYWNSQEERRAMRDASAAPRNSRELAVRNQFFTPRYVVEFLTDNTLGRIWYEMTKGETKLKEQCRYLVRRPTEIFLAEGKESPDQPEQEGLSQEELLKQPVHISHRPLKDPREIRLLDPACGSMHFGLYAFDLFEAIYNEAWDIAKSGSNPAGADESFSNFKLQVSNFLSKEAFLREVPRLIIEHNIHGVDIDPRAVQIAGLSLWLRAQKNWQANNVKPTDRPQIQRSNIVCAEPMPGSKEQLRSFCDSLNQPAIGGLVEHIFDKMQLAGEAGTLLKIEEEITGLLTTAKKDWLKAPKMKQAELFQDDELLLTTVQDQSELGLDFSGVTDEAFWDKAEERIYAALRDYAVSAEAGDYQRRLFAEDAAHGFAFIDLCRKRYDAVVMNPPFGDAGKQSKPYLTRRYPITKSELYSAFVERGLNLIDRGMLGAITSRSGFFQSSFEKWRTEILLPEAPPSAVADLGSGVLDGAMVETAAYSLAKGSRLQASQKSTFIRLGRTNDKESALSSAIESMRLGNSDDSLFLIEPIHFDAIPGTPFTYWVPASIRHIFRTLPRFESNECTVKQGLATADDFRFLRTFWESYPHLVARTKSDGARGKYWFPYPKGGEFSPFYSDIPLLVNWLDSGNELSSFGGSVIRSPSYYFKPGLTYPRRLHRLAVMPMPAGSIISVRGSGIYAPDPQLKRVGGLFSSSAFDFLVKCMLGRFDHPQFDNGTLCKTPVPEGFPGTGQKFEEPTNRAISLKRERDTTKELSHVFVCPPKPASQNTSLAAIITRWLEKGRVANEEIDRCQSLIDRVAFDLYQFDTQALKAVSESTSFGDNFNDEPLNDEIEKEEPIDLTTETPNFLSYSLGTAFGRWDIRYATGERQPPELPDPFDPLPVCPPGMLQGDDGLPMPEAEFRKRFESEDVPSSKRSESVPLSNQQFQPLEGGTPSSGSHYPLHIVWSGILVDDEQHPDDIVTRVRDALRVIWGERAPAIEQEAIEILQGQGRTPKDLRDYFRTPAQFFASHLARYSKSRRKAPIYWPLSTESGDFTLWLYYHRLDDQTLIRCVNRIEKKQESVKSERNALDNRSDRSSQEDSQLKALNTQLAELSTFKASLEKIAQFWKPNLNDGVQITAAPLWEHFRHKPWQKVLKDTWKQLEHGDYNWSHLAHSIWPERVVPKCAQDRSLAIAHGHEARLWHQAEVEKGKKKKKTLVWQPVPNAGEVVAEILEELKN